MKLWFSKLYCHASPLLFVCCLFNDALSNSDYEHQSNHNYIGSCIVGLIPQSLQIQAELTLASVGLYQVMRVHVDRCVPVVWVLEVSVFICLCNTCNHVTEAGGLYGFSDSKWRLSMQYDRDSLDLVLLYIES